VLNGNDLELYAGEVRSLARSSCALIGRREGANNSAASAERAVAVATPGGCNAMFPGVAEERERQGLRG